MDVNPSTGGDMRDCQSITSVADHSESRSSPSLSLKRMSLDKQCTTQLRAGNASSRQEQCSQAQLEEFFGMRPLHHDCVASESCDPELLAPSRPYSPVRSGRGLTRRHRENSGNLSPGLCEEGTSLPPVLRTRLERSPDRSSAFHVKTKDVSEAASRDERLGGVLEQLRKCSSVEQPCEIPGEHSLSLAQAQLEMHDTCEAKTF